MRYLAASVLLLGLVASGVRAEEAVSLFAPQEPNWGWTFDNGREFPGATGKIAVDEQVQRNGKPTLRLDGDFSKGGGYVQIGRDVSELKVDIRELSFWLRCGGADRLTLRVVDGGGKCHQIVLKIEATDQWQQVVLPLERFFAKQGTAEAVTTVAKYEQWGGAKDAKWTGPAKGVYLLLGPTATAKVRSLWVSDMIVLPRTGAQAAATAEVAETVRLDKLVDGETDWGFSLGGEVPGAKGKLSVVQDEPAPGQACLKMAGDFTGGGAYVAAIKDLTGVAAKDLVRVRLRVKTTHAEPLSVQLVDGTGQCHQRKDIKVVADGQWHELVLDPLKIAGGEHWGGANDGKWHGPATKLALNLKPAPGAGAGAGADAAAKQPVVYLADIAADVLVAAVVKAAAYRCDFEVAGEFAAGWKVEGKAGLVTEEPFKGKAALGLERALADVDKPCAARGPSFAVTPGPWEIGLAMKADLQSPDASYSGEVALECLAAGGNVVERIGVTDTFGKKNWQPVSKRVEVPKGATAARFVVQINKATGQFWVDELSAAAVAAVAPKDERVGRILFSTAQLGNLLLPEDKRTVDVTVEAAQPLEEKQQTLTWVVRDYWGSEWAPPAQATLARAGRNGKLALYKTTLDLSNLPLEMGRYYEVHAAIPRAEGEPFTHNTSLAILPAAATKQYKPQEIPFTSRDWDNRITEYFLLSDRLGVRIAGIWGGWSADPPYAPTAPQIDLCAKLGMGALTGTPVHAIEYHEKGYEKLDDKALRQGVRNFLEKYGKVTQPLIIDLGNEPHGTGERVLENVRGYKSVYEEVKKVDPSITVVATSVEPNEEYFKAGYQNYCDVFDFHIYEDYQSVRQTIQKYRELMKKYNCEKPLWSTELGLNSQGMTRHAVAVDVVKKLSTFFAAGGASVSWFDLVYPDNEGKNFGTSGEAHNIFDCRYSRYCPKLDAVAYYNMVNGICIKKFVGEKQYDGGITAMLFRDRAQRALQILWQDRGRQDVLVPLPEVGKVEVIQIDGRRSALDAGGKGVTLSMTEDPLLLLYDGGPAALPAALGKPAATLTAIPEGIVRGGSASLGVSIDPAAARAVALQAPPLWDVKGPAAEGGVAKFTVTAPEASRVREASLVVAVTDAAGKRCGELYCRPPVTGRLTVRVLPAAAVGGKPGGVRLLIGNHGAEKQELTWDLALLEQRTLERGQFGPPVAAEAYFAEAARGAVTVDGGKSAVISVPLSGVDPLRVYGVRAVVTDASGRTLSSERALGGFVAVPHAKGPIKLEGGLDEADWQRAPVQRLDQARQFFALNAQAAPWKGPADLSATVQFLWDEHYLYVGVKVTDDVAGPLRQDDSLWMGDSLQFLVDPCRDSAAKVGKYDYVVALGKKGPQVWCSLSADAGAPNGDAKDIVVSCRRDDEKTGSITYKLAIPWSRVAPFKPARGADLGMAMIANEDDGKGRASFITWFGNPHTKDIDVVGDLVLED